VKLEAPTLLKNPEAGDVISLSGQIMARHQGNTNKEADMEIIW
jgi:hypothetical protein